MQSESPKARSVTLSSKGQVTISARARKLLGVDRGDTLIEVVVGKCVILMPVDRILAETQRRAAQALKQAGVTVEQLKLEADKKRAARVTKRYPALK